MRYDRKIYFVKSGEKTYDPASGNYKTQEPVKVGVMASVTDTGAEAMTLEYGKFRQGSLTIHIQNHYTDAFDYIEYEGKKYSVDRSGRLRTKAYFIVSEAL